MKQPLGIVAVLYLLGLLLGNFFQLPLPCLFTVSLTVAVAAFLLHRLRSYLLWSLIILTGWTNLVWHTSVVSPIDLRVLLNDKPVLARVRGTLAATPTERLYVSDEEQVFRTTARINVTAFRNTSATESNTDWQPAFGQVAIISSGELTNNFYAGQQIEVSGVLALPRLPVADGLFDFRNYLRRQEIYFQLKTDSASGWEHLDTHTNSSPLRERFTAWAEDALARGIPEKNEPLLLEYALTLGDKTFLTDQASEPFVRASTYHIFAVDGLRMAIIFGIFFTSLRTLRIPRTACACILIPLIWFYVALTGWPPSAIRASVMLTIVIVGWMLKRPVDVLNSLYAAALIILLWQPQQLFQAGFQLSFFVVLCILLVMPVFDDWVQRLLKTDPLLPEELRPRWQRILNVPLRFILGLFFSSLAAWLGSIPLVAYYFHIITPISPIANIVAVPLCVLVLASNLISLSLVAWFPSGAVLFNHIGWTLMHWIDVTSRWFASWPHAYAYVPMPSLFIIIAYYAVLLAVLTGWLFQPNRRAWKIAGLALLVAVSCGQWLYQRSATHITVLPLGKGNIIYCDSPGSNKALIDCGDEKTIEFVTKPYLRAQGVNSLPQLALTVGAAEQVDGFGKLNESIPIEKVLASAIKFRSPEYRDIMQLLDKTPTRRQVMDCGNASGNWTMLYPPRTNHFPRADDNAMVLRGDFQGTHVLLLSNLGRTGQSELVGRNSDLRADIVIAGLAEQGEPLSPALLDAIQPKLIVVTDLKRYAAERGGSHELKDRLERRGIPVLYVRDTSAVNIVLRKNRWEAKSQDGSQSASGSKSSLLKEAAP
ncbi:MAG TPA: ComEC/Rec2 family competence protein [Verrucomicrobiae bacterium]|nr:ComEC/Rec2 family competence protein [Verrucomicrobiae bacterium]